MSPTTPDPRIRQATPADSDALAALAARTFRDAYGGGLSPDDLARHLEAHCSPAALRHQLTLPGAVTLVAEVGQAEVGYAQLEPAPVPPEVVDPTAIRLARFYLDQAWIGKGIAQRLMERVRAEASSRGHATLWLTVWEKAPRPIAFYQRCGFRQVGVTQFAIGADVQQDWLMACPLPEADAGASRYRAI